MARGDLGSSRSLFVEPVQPLADGGIQRTDDVGRMTADTLVGLGRVTQHYITLGRSARAFLGSAARATSDRKRAT